MAAQTDSSDSKSGKPASTKSVTQSTSNKKQLAVVLVRGMTGMRAPVKDTLYMLRLRRKNHCVIVPNTPALVGMLVKVKDYITWGEVDEGTFEELVAARGEMFQEPFMDRKRKYSYKCLEFKGKKYKPYFRLNPPRQGFGRKGVKVSFRAGGSLGYRGEEMNSLLKRMM